MARADQAKSAVPYLQRLVEDEYVQEQLRNAVARLREAYERVHRKRGKAAEDKKLYGNLRQAAGSIRNATTALQRRKPEPKRGGRKLLAIAVAGGAAAMLLRRRGREEAPLTPSTSEPGGDGGAFTPASSHETPAAASVPSSHGG